MNKLQLQKELFKTRAQMLRMLNELGLLDEVNRLAPVRYDSFGGPYNHLRDIDEAIAQLHRRLNTDPHFASLTFMDRGTGH